MVLMVLTASLTSPRDAAGSPPHPLLMSKKQDGIINQINVFGHWETIAAADYSGPDGFADEALDDVAAQPEENWYAFSVCEDGATSPSSSSFRGAVMTAMNLLTARNAPFYEVTGTCSEQADGIVLFPQDGSGEREVNEDHSIYLVEWDGSQQYNKIQERKQQYLNAGHAGFQIGGMTRYRGMKKGLGSLSEPVTQRVTWQVYINGVDRGAGYTLPEMTTEYAGTNPATSTSPRSFFTR